MLNKLNYLSEDPLPIVAAALVVVAVLGRSSLMHRSYRINEEAFSDNNSNW